MAQSYIGKPISLISHSDVRYRGILAGIDPAASTIQLSNVYSMGTESRRPPHEFIPPVQEPYQYIIFRASEVKDLAVDDPVPPRRSVHDDPAVLGASAQVANPNISPYPVPAPVAHQHLPQVPHPHQVPPQHPQQPPQQFQQVPPQAQVQAQTQAQQHQQQQQQQQQQRAQNNSGGQRRNPVHTAAASLETVERAIGDLRVSQAQAAAAQAIVASANQHQHNNGYRGGGGRRGGGPGRGGHQQGLKVPTTDFDFESMNAKFDKAALATPRTGSAAPSSTPNGAAANGEEGVKTPEGGDKENEGKKEPDVKSAYNPKASFFDSLTSGTPPTANGGGGRGVRRGGRGGGGGGRNRREEEREKNVATFGEPGGVGLMGPGAYVGGWGGYGRRGGRPRRGGPAPSATGSAVVRG